MTLSGWDEERGEEPRPAQPDSTISGETTSAVPHLTAVELAHLHGRVIALENLVIALLAEGSDRKVVLAREMAAYISPRPGFTQHPPTIHAAAQMLQLVKRAAHFRCN